MSWAKLDDAPFAGIDGYALSYKHRDRYGALAYFVGWPRDLIVKIGVGNTERPRYKTFIPKGADLLAVAHSPTCWATTVERLVETWLWEQGWSAAFATKDDAYPYLGSGGGGYTECYRAPDVGTYAWGLAVCAFIVSSHDGDHECADRRRC